MGLFRRGTGNSASSSNGSARRPPPTLEQSAAEAADQDLAGQSKLQVANQAVILEQLRQIAQDEIRDVRRLKAKHLGEQWAKAAEGQDVGDLIICDDYRRNEPHQQPPSPRIWPLIAALLGFGGLGLAGYLGHLALSRPAAVAPAVQQKIENTTKGFLIELLPSKRQ